MVTFGASPFATSGRSTLGVLAFGTSGSAGLAVGGRFPGFGQNVPHPPLPSPKTASRTFHPEFQLPDPLAREESLPANSRAHREAKAALALLPHQAETERDIAPGVPPESRSARSQLFHWPTGVRSIPSEMKSSRRLALKRRRRQPASAADSPGWGAMEARPFAPELAQAV